MGRRVRKLVYAWDPNAGDWSATPELDRRFVYYNWLPVVEYEGADNAKVRKYVWGLDLAARAQNPERERGAQIDAAGGTLDGPAAGQRQVGGMIAMRDVASGTNCICLYDAALDTCLSGRDPGCCATGGRSELGARQGWGCNLAQLMDGSLDARYEYDPYGTVIGPDDDGDGDWRDDAGPYAVENPIRFSTKYWDDETGLGYWGYRYYSPGLGRWISRDPLEEKGGLNVYGYVLNDAIGFLDPHGLIPPDVPPWPPGENPFWPRGRDNKARPASRPAGTVTITITDCCRTGGSASISVGLELDRTGQLRLRYNDFVHKLNELDLTPAERSAARDALQEQFGRLQTEFGKRFTEAWRAAHPKRRTNAGKANIKVTGYAKTACHLGKACVIVGMAADIYVIATSDDPLIETVRVGGSIAGGYGGMLAGAWVGGKVGAACGTCAGPWGAAMGGVGGAIFGACCGEMAVAAAVDWIKSGGGEGGRDGRHGVDPLDYGPNRWY